MRIIHLALKDLRQVLRDRNSLLFLLLMPIVFTFFFGFAFGGMGKDQDSDNRLPIGVINQDPDGILAEALVSLLGSSETVRPVLISEEDAEKIDQQVLRGDYVAGLVIPSGYSAATLQGEKPMLQVIIDEESDDGQTARRALQTNITRLMSLVETATLSAAAYEAQVGFESAAARQVYTDEAIALGLEGWEAQPLSIQVTGPAAAPDQNDPLAVNPYNQFSPGMMVQFAIFGLIQAAMIMVVERRTGAMSRMLTTPMTKVELIGGHVLAMFIIFFGQQLILVLFGQIFLGVNYFAQPLATLLLMAAISLWVAALGLFISTMAKKEEHVIMGSMIAMFLFSALGGAWFSLEMVGNAFSTIGHLTPSAWAIDGYQNIIMRGLGFNAVLLPVGIILAYALAFFGIAIWRFRYE